MSRYRFITACPNCRRRKKILTRFVDGDDYVKSAFCYGCRKALSGFKLNPPRLRIAWTPPTPER